MSDLLNGAGTEPAASEPSLRDALSKAWDEPSPAAPAPQSGAEGVPEPAAPAEPAQAETPAGGQPRDPHGRFAPKAGDAPPAAQAALQAGANPAPGTEELADRVVAPEVAQGLRAPPGWSPAAKAEYRALPDSVKTAIAAREKEISVGFAAYDGLGPFEKMARQGGKTLPQVLQAYVGMEQMLRTNPEQGLLEIFRNIGLDPRRFAEAIIGSQAPAQPGADGQPQPAAYQQPQPLPELVETQRRLESLEHMIRANQNGRAMDDVGRFFNDPANEFAENVAPQMAMLIETGQVKSVQDAYDKACWLNNEVRDVLLKRQVDQRIAALKPAQTANAKQAAASQARVAGASVAGSPAATPPPGAGRDLPLRDQIASLMNSGV